MRALVTGGGGFLGGAIVRQLVDRGWTVRTLQRGSYEGLEALGVEQIRGDIADSAVVDHSVVGCDIVFHVAARVEMWGPIEPFLRTNVVGTENVLAAMRRHGVRRLVFTSSPSVVHSRDGLEGVDESVPYPDRYGAAYPQTKAMAEMAVLASNGPDLATVALRPHLIWGPGDTNLVPHISWPLTTSNQMPPAPAKPTSSPMATRGRSRKSSTASSRREACRPKSGLCLSGPHWLRVRCSKASTASFRPRRGLG